MTVARIAVIGAGWWSTEVHLPALAAAADAETVAIVDPSAEPRDAAAKAFGIPRAYSDAADLFADGGVDGVIVATPHHTHVPLVEQALAAGMHVLVEKPMALTGADAARLVQQERRGSARIVVGLTYQFAACAPHVRAWVRGEIGDLVSVNAEFSSNTQPLLEGAESPGGPDRGGSGPTATYSDPATGGGQGYTQMSHLLGGVMWATGQQAVEAFAYMDTRAARVDVVDAVAFRLEAGALGVASSTGTTPQGAPARHRIRFHGTAGVVEWDMLGAEAWLHKDGCSRLAGNPANRAPYGSAQVAPEFVRVIRGESENPAPADSAAASIALIEAAYRSAASGAPSSVVRISPDGVED